MDDVLVEMEVIREFVVESLVEFCLELLVMNLKIQFVDKKIDELDNLYKDICEKYFGLEEIIENVFQLRGNSFIDLVNEKNIFQMMRRRRMKLVIFFILIDISL